MTDIAIGNQALVIKHFGHWPSFHDAEIDRVQSRRGEPGYWPIISLWINVFGPRDKSEDISKADRLWQIALEFTEVVDNELEGFNHQNVIFALTFQQAEGLILCSIDTSHGMSGNITARCVTVKSMIAIDENK